MVAWNDITLIKPTNDNKYKSFRLILVYSNWGVEPAWVHSITQKIIDAENEDITTKVKFWAEFSEINTPENINNQHKVNK